MTASCTQGGPGLLINPQLSLLFPMVACELAEGKGQAPWPLRPSPQCPLHTKPGQPFSHLSLLLRTSGAGAINHSVNHSLNKYLQMLEVRSRQARQATRHAQAVFCKCQESSSWSPGSTRDRKGFKLIAEHNAYQREVRVLGELRGWELPETPLLFLFFLA